MTEVVVVEDNETEAEEERENGALEGNEELAEFDCGDW
jgi:hypothetical protein